MKVMIIGGGNSGNQNMVTAINKAFGEGVELIIPEDQGSDPTPISTPYFHYGKMDFDIIKDVELKEPPHWKQEPTKRNQEHVIMPNVKNEGNELSRIT